MSQTKTRKPETQKALDAKLQEIRSELEKWNRGDVKGRRGIGQHIASIKNNARKYGLKAVETIAQQIGVSDSWLYDCATVAEAWTAEQIETILRRKDEQRKQPLSWTHLVLLAEVDDKKERRSWVDGTLQNGWTVKELRAHLNPSPEDEDEPAEKSDSELEDQAVGRWLRNIQAFAESDVSKQNQWNDTLFSPDGPGIGIESPEDMRSLDQAIEAVEHARDGYTDLLKKLKKAVKQQLKDKQEAAA